MKKIVPGGQILLPGDIVLVKRSGPLSRLIKRFTRSIGESKTLYTHCEMVIAPGRLEDAIVVSADKPGITRRKLTDLTGRTGAVYRVDYGHDPLGMVGPLNRSIGWNIAERIQLKLGAPYPVWRLVMHMLDWFLLDAFLFRRVGRSSKTMECSSLVAWAVSPYVQFRDRPWYLISPDDIADSLDAWEVSGKTAKITEF